MGYLLLFYGAMVIISLVGCVIVAIYKKIREQAHMDFENVSNWEEFMSEYDMDMDNMYGDNDND